MAVAPTAPSRERLDAWLETWVRRDGVAWARSTRLHRASVMDKWIAPSLGRADRPADALCQGGFLHLGNLRAC